MEGPGFDVIVLAGGTSRRLGGVDKLKLQVAGRSLLDHVLMACRGATRVIAVGPPRPVLAYDEEAAGMPSYELVWCREDPPGGGPLAATRVAALRAKSPVVAIVGGDMPFVAPLLTRLVTTVSAGAPAAACPDETGRPLPLPCAFTREVLLHRLADTADPFGRPGPLRRLLDGVSVTLLPDDAGDADDVDTPEQLQAARNRSGQTR